jgi:hypothetical protein
MIFDSRISTKGSEPLNAKGAGASAWASISAQSSGAGKRVGFRALPALKTELPGPVEQ